jgi:hypothetical protein
MTPVELFTILTAAGCRLIPDGERLRVQDPQQALTEELRQAIRQHKPGLLAILAPRPPRHAGGFKVTDADHPCTLCGCIEWQQHVTYRYCLLCGREVGAEGGEATRGKVLSGLGA